MIVNRRKDKNDGEVFGIKTYKIYFIRHGATEGNREGKYIGVTDEPLSPEGIEELEELRREYDYPRAEIVYASPLRRCIQTAEMLFPDTDIQSVEKIKEYNFGIFENKKMDELKDDPAYQSWISGGMVATPPNGEDKEAFYHRLRHGFEDILQDMMQKKLHQAAVVTHGGVIMSLLTIYGYPRRKPLDWQVGSGKGYTALITPQIWSGGQVFEVFDPLPYGSAAYSEDYDLVEIAPDQE